MTHNKLPVQAVLFFMVLLLAAMACNLPAAGGNGLPSEEANAQVSQYLTQTAVAMPTNGVDLLTLATVTPTAQPSCDSPKFKTFHVFVTPDGPGFGEWDSNLALSRWTNVGIALEWAKGKPFANCYVDFIYDEPTENPFIVIHAGEATYEDVVVLKALVQASEIIYVYRTTDNTDVMSRTPAPEGTEVTFLRFQVYKNAIEIPEILRASWEQ